MELLQEFSDQRAKIRRLHVYECDPSSSQHRDRTGLKSTGRSRTEVLVVPATKTDHPEWLPLTNLDRLVYPTFISVIFFYDDVLKDSDDVKTFQDLTASLKDSLAKTLVPFYPLAGRMTMKETGLVDLQCNDAGAIFMQSSVNYELRQLGGPQPLPVLSGMDILNNVVRKSIVYIPDQVNTEIPVLVINVTKFLCGSIAVAVNWHHTVADGFSGCHFVRSWAQVATGQAMSLLPSHDRHLLQPRSPLDASTVKNSSSHGKLLNPIHLSARRDHRAAMPCLVKPFFLRQDTVQRLRQEANNHTEVDSCISTSNSKRPFTSAETVSAELWKLLTKARSADYEEAASLDRSRFFMFVDGRKRLGLPTGYFGNVVCAACAESTNDELVRKPLTYVANLISTATRAVNEEYIRSLIDWVEEMRITSTGCQSEHLNATGDDVAATFWIFLPLYEINFGYGKPVLSVRNAPPRKLLDGISMMPSPDGMGNMVALLNLHADRMDKLERDPGFQKLAEPLNHETLNHETHM